MHLGGREAEKLTKTSTPALIRTADVTPRHSSASMGWSRYNVARVVMVH